MGSPFWNHSDSDMRLLLQVWPACGSWFNMQTPRCPPRPSGSERATKTRLPSDPCARWGVGVLSRPSVSTLGTPIFFHRYHSESIQGLGGLRQGPRLPPALWVLCASQIEATRKPTGTFFYPRLAFSPRAVRVRFTAPSIWGRHGVNAKPRLQSVGCLWALPVETDGVSGPGEPRGTGSSRVQLPESVT